MENITYRVKEGQENVSDPRELVIVKTGHETELSLLHYDSFIMQNDKEEKAVQAQLDYEQAIVTNIEQNHPFVTQMPPEQLVTVWMYKEALGKVKMAKEKVAEIQAATGRLKAEEAAMIAALPELMPVEKADEAADSDEAAKTE